MLVYCGNKKLLKQKGIGVCGSLYPSEYGMQVVKDFVDKQKQTLIFHDEKGIARLGIRQAKINGQKIIIISKYKPYIQYPNNGQVLYIWIKENNEELYVQVFEQLIDKLAVIELAKSSSLLLLIDNLINNNIEIYVIPGTIYSKNSSGCNLLIAEGANLLYDELEI